MTAPPPATTTPTQEMPLLGQIALAITSPGTVLPRRDHTETINEWTYRAILAVTGIDQIPAGMDARPVILFTVHCSHCGKPAPHVEYGDELPSLWRIGELKELTNYHLQDSDWHLDITGTDPDHEGRPAVCDDCWCAAWCEVCDSEIHAWQERATLSDTETAHQRCVDNEKAADALAAELEALGDAGMAAHMEVAALSMANPNTAARLAEIRAAVLPATEAIR